MNLCYLAKIYKIFLLKLPVKTIYFDIVYKISCYVKKDHICICRKIGNTSLNFTKKQKKILYWKQILNLDDVAFWHSWIKSTEMEALTKYFPWIRPIVIDGQSEPWPWGRVYVGRRFQLSVSWYRYSGSSMYT